MHQENLTRSNERILIVDDTPANIDVLGAILMEEYDISVAVNGPMAIEIAKSDTPPDLILLDIMMPEMDGYEVARELKSERQTRQIPIIFVTAKIEDRDEAFGFQVGAVDYIRKPVNPSITLARIKSQLELKRYKDHLTRLVEEKEFEVTSSRRELEHEKERLSKVSEDLVYKKAAAHKHEVYFRELFMNSPYGIVLVGRDNRIIRTNKSFSKLLGYSVSDILNKRFPGFPVEDLFRSNYEMLLKNARNGETVSVEIQCLHKNGFEIPISALAYPVKVDNQVQGVFVFYENISQRKLFEEKLKHQAYHDSLTGIPNRLLFSERLDIALENRKNGTGFKFAVLLIDLDRFKSVNDSLGHQAGDELLQLVSAKIKECLRTKDTLARLGGDEFAILLPDIESREKISIIAARIAQAAESRFIVQNQEVSVSASIGIVIQTESYENANHLLRDADLAMYHAKDSGKAQFKFFTPKMHETLMASITIENELKKAVEKEELILYFQPIFHLPKGEIEGFEALVRWMHPRRGLVSPDQFIPIAEENGLIFPMGEWIIEQACLTLAAWKEWYAGRLSMSINVSIRQFLQKGFVDRLTGILKRFSLVPRDIKLEFTESLLMEHSSRAVRALDTLKERGFILSIDDFGTGYSSLAYLQQFPIDQIKIDRSFIGSIEKKGDSFEIVKSILSLSKSLGLSTVAEGVETREQIRILNRLSCESAQGYYFSKPMPPDLAGLFLKNKAYPRK